MATGFGAEFCANLEPKRPGTVRALSFAMPVWGIAGHPFIDLERYVDVDALTALHDEIALGLALVPVEYTGGSHKTMGIVPPSLGDTPYVDYGHVLARMSDAELATFVSLAEDSRKFDPAHLREYGFGEEREHPLTKKQMLFLKYRYGVYFPWQVFYEMIPTLNWEDKANGHGKDFTREAKLHFPRLVAFVRSLPFSVVGRCNILGLDADHHGTVHHDGNPADPEAEHFITLCPKRDKRLFLWDEARKKKTIVSSRAYWFNDHGYHGVEPDPFFRYSIRVDGVFEPDFLARVRRDWRI
jgi:hypothetical protein